MDHWVQPKGEGLIGRRWRIEDGKHGRRRTDSVVKI